MDNFFQRLIYVFRCGPELAELLAHKEEEIRQRDYAATKDNLNLCFKHQQERNHSHFSEHNCDYCKLLMRMNDG